VAPQACSAGVLCGRAGTSDVIDASVILCAREREHQIVTSDPQDLKRLDAQLSVIVV
jgi:tagatose-1,6-bisphosphate aldolase